MGRDHGHAADVAEVSGNRYGQGRALFGIRGRAELVEQDQRVLRRRARDEVDICHVG